MGWWVACLCGVDVLMPQADGGEHCPSCGEWLGMGMAEMNADALQVTTELPPLGFQVPETVEAMLAGSASRAGWHAVSGYLACPEASRLRSLRVRRKGWAWEHGSELDARGFGLLIHAALAIRSLWGQGAVLQWLEMIRPGLYEPDYLKALIMMRVYDDTYPAATDPLRILGVEIPVNSNVGYPDSLIRTVRYDAVVQIGNEPCVYSLERKTDSRGGASAMAAYTPQAAVQCAIWNANPSLVNRYGLMRGIIWDILVKTVVPRCERVGPNIVPKHQQGLALQYMRQTEAVKFPVEADGSYPKFLHTCWGRFRPCEYVPLCWENAVNLYEQVGGAG